LSKRKSISHYLLTIHLCPGWHIHAYAMAADPRDLLDVGNGMVTVAEKAGLAGPLSNIVLETRLSDDVADPNVKFVRQVCLELGGEKVAQLFKTVKDFHHTMFAMMESDPRDKRLMELH